VATIPDRRCASSSCWTLTETSKGTAQGPDKDHQEQQHDHAKCRDRRQPRGVVAMTKGRRTRNTRVSQHPSQRTTNSIRPTNGTKSKPPWCERATLTGRAPVRDGEFPPAKVDSVSARAPRSARGPPVVARAHRHVLGGASAPVGNLERAARLPQVQQAWLGRARPAASSQMGSTMPETLLRLCAGRRWRSTRCRQTYTGSLGTRSGRPLRYPAPRYPLPVPHGQRACRGEVCPDDSIIVPSRAARPDLQHLRGADSAGKLPPNQDG